jgi:hypothetical protein
MAQAMMSMAAEFRWSAIDLPALPTRRRRFRRSRKDCGCEGQIRLN